MVARSGWAQMVHGVIRWSLLGLSALAWSAGQRIRALDVPPAHARHVRATAGTVIAHCQPCPPVLEVRLPPPDETHRHWSWPTQLAFQESATPSAGAALAPGGF